MDAIRKQEIIKEYGRHEGDTGSPEVANRIINRKNQFFNWPLKNAQERSPLKKRSFNDGWSKKRSSKLLS